MLAYAKKSHGKYYLKRKIMIDARFAVMDIMRPNVEEWRKNAFQVGQQGWGGF